VDSFAGRNGLGPARPDPAPALSGIMRVIVAVSDLELAATVYGAGFGLPVDNACADVERGVRSVLCAPPAGGTIELVAAENTERPFARSVAQHLDTRGEGMFALILGSQDLDACRHALRTRGAEVDHREWAPHQLALSAEAFFGVRLCVDPSA
jgi:hypothetical protein